MTAIAEKSGLGDDCKWPKEEAKPAEGEGEKPAAEEAAADMEGGEEAAATGMEAAMEKAKFLDAGAFGESGGAGLLPKLLIEQMALNPFFGDLVKSQTLFWEFGGNHDDETAWAGAATLTGALVAAGEKAGEDGEFWGASWLTEDDKAELDEAFADKDNKALVFPGVCFGYSS